MRKLAAALAFGVLASSMLFAPYQASAVTASNWQAGRIIDDNVFTSTGAMSAADIQNFLNREVGVNQTNSTAGQCDTNGTHTSEFGGGTRAQYGAAHGNSAPFTCLKDYYEVPKTSPGAGIPASNYGGKPIPSGAISAAQIIYNAAQQYRINPEVLLVKIEQESTGPLITDAWPFQSQYTYALGSHCPDTADCDSNYAGFSIQIYSAAALFRYYLDNMSQAWWPYKKPGNNSILYSPSSSCGSSNVNIVSSATAALYTYTPYQPDAAAIANLYGTGDSCSSYGNRNFWRVYNDWFGPSTSLLGDMVMTNVSQIGPNPARGQSVSYVYSLTNNFAVPITLNAVGLVGRLGSLNGGNSDLGWQGPVTIQPGDTQQFTFSTVLGVSGPLYLWPAVLYQGTYVQYQNWGELLNIHNPNLALTSPLTSSLPNPIATQTATLSATIQNNESVPIQLDALGIPVRYYSTYNYDTGWGAGVTLQPGASQAVSGDVLFDKPGPYTAWLSGIVGGQFYTISPNLNLNVRPATPNFQMSYTQTPDTTPALGQDVTVAFSLTNNSGIPMTLDAVGVVGRYDNPYTGANNDFGWQGPETFSAGQTKSYSFTTNISQLNTYYAWPAIVYKGNYIHYNNWGFMLTPHVPNLSLSSPLTINSGTKPPLGQSVSVVATVKNNEPYPIKYGAVGIPARYYGVYNYDTAWQGAGTLAASGQSGDSVALSGSINFNKPGPYTVWPSILIDGRFITIGNVQNVNM